MPVNQTRGQCGRLKERPFGVPLAGAGLGLPVPPLDALIKQVLLSSSSRTLSHSEIGACSERDCNAERDWEGEIPVHPDRREEEKYGDKQGRYSRYEYRPDLVIHGPILLMRIQS